MNCEYFDSSDYYALLFSSTKETVSAAMRLDPHNISYLLQRIPKEITCIENMCTLSIVTNESIKRLNDILEDVKIHRFVLMRMRLSDERHRALIHKWTLDFKTQRRQERTE